jgi:hypothetical protein
MPDPIRLPDFVYGRTTYVVEKFEPVSTVLAVRYILRGPRGQQFDLIPVAMTPNRFMTSRRPFKGKAFEERNGTLVLA